MRVIVEFKEEGRGGEGGPFLSRRVSLRGYFIRKRSPIIFQFLSR